ncbi:AMP-dependent synthetase/ligase [Streptomyces sp. NPDC058464]|uniref:AMP-dependent synthetase/ligase n=1 Tax=Streptomyces sp. NPDC058464 TaxID=3346511 RepID=UPI0036498235
MTEALYATERPQEQTLPRLVLRNATLYGDAPALSSLDEADRPTITWAGLRQEIAETARGLAAIGLARGNRMLIMAASSPDHLIADLAAVHLGAISCTAYQTLSPDQIVYLARHSGARVVVLGGADELGRWKRALRELPAIRRVVLIDPAAVPEGDERYVSWEELRRTGAALHTADPRVFEDACAAVRPEDPLSMIYTSGTTGDPKGVVLSHRGVLDQSYALLELHGCPMHMTNISYLPLAHIAERQGSVYMPIVGAGHVHTLADPRAIGAALPKVRPQQFFGVPQLMEKLAAGLRRTWETLPPEAGAALLDAMELRKRDYDLRSAGQDVPAELTAGIAEVDPAVLAPVRRSLGLDRLWFLSCGSAPVPVEVLRTLAGVGLEVYEVLGMSETSGVFTTNSATGFRAGSVGRALGRTEVALADDGEILVRGAVVCLGYLQEDGRIRPEVDEKGWFATGDVGSLDDDGFLTVTDRKKEIIITSGGKNIAPAQVESLLREHSLVAQALAIGDRRPYVTALLVLDHEALGAWAAGQGLAGTEPALLAERPEIRDQLAQAVAAANARLARVEQVKRYRVITDPWSAATGETTETLKLKRRIIHERYAAEISALYTADTHGNTPHESEPVR